MNDRRQMLRNVYTVLAELWAHPEDVDDEMSGREREAVAEWEPIDADGAALLAKFLEDRISDTEYVELFELDPRCPPYLGSHSFDEPMTCAGAAISDRNGYMLDLLGIYKHFGMTPNGKELADYLPLMVEFLALSVDSDDPIRNKFVEEYVFPFLSPMRS